MQANPLPVPYSGMNDQVPLADLNPPFCEKLLNFNNTRHGLSLRNGDSLVERFGALTGYATGIATRGNESFIVETRPGSNDKVYSVDNSAVPVFTAAGTGLPFLGANIFSKNIFLWGVGSALGAVYDGSSWSDVAYTGSNLNPYGSATFNNRHYIIQGSTLGGYPAYWYSDIDAISGALHHVSLSSVCDDSVSFIAAIIPFTIADNVAAETLLAFVMLGGEVLFYSGKYPDDQSWQLRGRAKVGNPNWFNSFVPYQGDALLLCENGVISMRDLFLKGSEGAISLTVNSRIQRAWSDLMMALRASATTILGTYNGYVRGAWDRTNNRIVISCPGYLDSSGSLQVGGFYFVFDTINQSWSTHRSFGLKNTGYNVGIAANTAKLYFLTSDSFTTSNTHATTYKKEGSSLFLDDKYDNSGSYEGIEFDLISAPSDGGKIYVMKTEGIDLISNSDLYARIGVSLVGDLGVQTAGPLVVTDVHGAGGTVQKPFYNVGIEASYVQYKISGTTVPASDTTATEGFTLYGTNLWYEQGASPR